MTRMCLGMIVGEKEAADNLILLRTRKNGDMGQMKVEDFLRKPRNDLKTQTLGKGPAF
jgi:threonyl-tRNA synthetase